MRVVVTGASSGIGKALVEDLAGQGAFCVGVARRDAQLRAVISGLASARHSLAVGDLSREEDCLRVIAEAEERLGGIDTLVCNAGYGLFRTLEATTRADWDAIMATNLHGTLDCIRAALPRMRTQEIRDGWRGQIVIVSSILGRRGAPRCGAYCATKAAQLSVAEALRLELRSERIAVTSVHPVGTKTEFFDTAAERVGGKAASRTSAFDQTPAHVARRIRAAIRRPRAEVWPMRSARWLAAFCAIAPSWADRLVDRIAPQGE